MEPKWNQNGTKMEPQLNLTKPNTTPLPPSSDVENVENRPHGLRSTYAHGCRCEACRKANSDYEKARCRRVAAEKMGGRPTRRVPVEEARWRIRRLLEMGYTMNELERVTGLSDTVLTGIHRRYLNNHGVEKRWVNRSTIEALDRALDERTRNLADGLLVPADRTLAILRLMVEKLGRKGAARALGWSDSRLNNYLYNHRRRYVRLSTAREVAEKADAMRRTVRREHDPGTYLDRMKRGGYVVNPYTDE